MEVEDEWELLSDDGLLQISNDATAAANQICSRSTVFNTNYFICPSSPSQFVETTADRGRENDCDRDQPVQMINIDSFSTGGVDRDPFSQVFFKKMKEAEFVDIKVESPKFEAKANYQFEEKADPRENEMKEVEYDLEEDGANVWKWSLSGIGAICSFGMAAATFCVIVFTKHPHHNHKLQFRIYTDEKRMKVKGAIAAVSGVPINRARITVGGYYDAPPLSL